MPRAIAKRELPASREDVWAFIAEPGRFAEWWPRVAAVRADRRGLVEGARWVVESTDRPAVFRRSGYSGTLLVREVEPPKRVAWTLTGDRFDAELRLEETASDRTRAVLEVTAAWLVPLPRSLPRRALVRLHDLVQAVEST
jgi:uncharacterized protein YndB with AHSA1/START domain